MKKGTIRIGTSGWHYKHWKGIFYPETIKEADQLRYYVDFFHTVEVNNSFYMLPQAKTFSQWRKTVPENFVFSVKGSRFITHLKKLNVDKENINTFLHNAGQLKEKLGPVLFQLPPRWKVNTERLEEFLAKLPKDHLYTFEFRDHTWYDEQVYALLRKYNGAFCIYELERHLSPMEVTADFVYIRLHGPGDKYQGSYTDARLKTWALHCLQWQKEGKDVYVYFDNDQAGFAAFNAKRLKEMVE